jgi:hypothetical protein
VYNINSTRFIYGRMKSKKVFNATMKAFSYVEVLPFNTCYILDVNGFYCAHARNHHITEGGHKTRSRVAQTV